MVLITMEVGGLSVFYYNGGGAYVVSITMEVGLTYYTQ